MKKIKFITLALLACIFMGLSANAQTGCGNVFITVPPGALPAGTYTSQNLHITGAISISGAVTFDNCNIWMDPATQITMSGSASALTITNFTHIFCCGDLWWGIYKGANTGMLSIDNSLIEDAGNAGNTVAAVNINVGSSFSIRNTVFNKNKTAIRINATVLSIPNSIKNTVFTCRTMPPSYFVSVGGNLYLDPINFSSVNAANDILSSTLASSLINGIGGAPPSIVAQIGIRCNAVNNIQIGDDINPGYLNTFDNMNQGISLNLSSAVIYNNRFLNQSKNASIGMTNPEGILAQGNPGKVGPAYSITVGGNANPMQLNTFNENLFAMDIRFYEFVNIYNNVIHDNATIATSSTALGVGLYGISIWPDDQSWIEVFNNTITNCNTGIYIYRNANGYDANEIILDNNTISSNTLTGAGFCKTGIYLQDNVLQNPSLMNPDKYKVRFNNVTECYTCLYAINLEFGLVIHDNGMGVIHNPVVTATGRGIELNGCFKPRVFRNNINNYDNNLFAFDNIVTTSHAGTTANPIPRYIGFYDNGCTTSEIRCNTITGLGESMTFNNVPNTFNYVLMNNMSTGINGWALRGTTILGPQGSATTACGQTWAPGTFSSWATYTNGPLPVNSTLYVEGAPGSTTNPLPNGGTTPYNFLPAQGLEPGAATTYNCTTDIIIQAIAGGGGGGGAELGARELTTLTNDTTQHPDFDAEIKYQNKMTAYSVLDTTNGIIAGDSTGALQAFYDSAKVTTMGQLKDVDNAIVNKDYATADATNNGVTVSNQIQANQKLVNYYYLLKLNDTAYEYSSADSAGIYSVAVQCQSEGGSVIWQARAMYFDIMGERVDFDDYCLSVNKSLVHSTSTNSPQQNNNVRLYPNPNNGNFTLEYYLGDNGTGSISIYDITGKLIRNYDLTNASQSKTINTNSIEAGVYFYNVLINNTKIKTDKLIIIK